MNLPINKNKNWISQLHHSIDQLDENQKAAVMKPAGKACAADIMALCERHLSKKVSTIDELVEGWNIIRGKAGLNGRWEFEENTIRGIFRECGCPLVRSGLIILHSVQCYCSQGMMETIFSEVAQRPIAVEIKQAIGRGDAVCHFVVKL